MAAEHATARITIAAPAARVYDTLTDFESAPEWQSVLRSATVRERDADGRGTEVEFVLDLKVRRIRYVHRYEHDAPGLLRFRTIEGDIRSSHGTYAFTDRGDGTTEVVAEMDVDPGVFVPGPLKRLLGGRVLQESLSELRDRCEAPAP